MSEHEDRSSGKEKGIISNKTGTRHRSSNKSPRAVALELLYSILEEGNMVQQVLRRGLDAHPEYDRRQRSFITCLTEGTVERCIEMDYVLGLYSNTPVGRMKPVIRTIMRMSVYQLLYMDSVPESAAVNEAVKLAEARGYRGLKGFVNGVLRSVASDKGNIVLPAEDTDEGISVRCSMPVWLVRNLSASYGRQNAEIVCRSLIKPRKLSVHVNISRADPQRVCESLESQGVSVQVHPYSPQNLILTDTGALSQLEAFRLGWIQPQDTGSQLASSLAVSAMKECFRLTHQHAQVQPHSRGQTLQILDVCAAPGGKSLYVADAACAAGISALITDWDQSDEKIAQIGENLDRTLIKGIQTQKADARVFRPEWEQRADIVIADLPCSGLGSISRRSDLKYHITPEKMEELAALQRDILDACARYVRPRGYLIYSTCTLNPAENEDNLKWLREKYPFAGISVRPWLPDALRQLSETSRTPDDGYLTLLPGVYDSDGFFISVSQRTQSSVPFRTAL